MLAAIYDNISVSHRIAIQAAGAEADALTPYPRPGDAEREEAKVAKAQSQFERWQARQAAREAG